MLMASIQAAQRKSGGGCFLMAERFPTPAGDLIFFVTNVPEIAGAIQEFISAHAGPPEINRPV